MKHNYSQEYISNIIRLAWLDKVSFDQIKREQNITEHEVIKIMRSHLKPGSFRLWRKRVSGRDTKHERRTKLIHQEADQNNLRR
jgi:uncharacterized protein (TIGR03643 family)